LKSDTVRGALVAAVHRREDFPRRLLPVVAFVGRSNVGKSSLLNRILGTHSARVGKTPGKTRGIYIYETDEGHWVADLPGAGFARASRAEREGWSRLADLLFGSGGVRLAVHLLDPAVPGAVADRHRGGRLLEVAQASLEDVGAVVPDSLGRPFHVVGVVTVGSAEDLDLLLHEPVDATDLLVT